MEIISLNSDGTERWRHQIANECVYSTPFIGENGVVYIGSSSDDYGSRYGYVYAFGDGINTPPYDLTMVVETVGRINYNYTYEISAKDNEGNAI